MSISPLAPNSLQFQTFPIFVICISKRSVIVKINAKCLQSSRNYKQRWIKIIFQTSNSFYQLSYFWLFDLLTPLAELSYPRSEQCAQQPVLTVHPIWHNFRQFSRGIIDNGPPAQIVHFCSIEREDYFIILSQLERNNHHVQVPTGLTLRQPHHPPLPLNSLATRSIL